MVTKLKALSGYSHLCKARMSIIRRENWKRYKHSSVEAHHKWAKNTLIALRRKLCGWWRLWWHLVGSSLMRNGKKLRLLEINTVLPLIIARVPCCSWRNCMTWHFKILRSVWIYLEAEFMKTNSSIVSTSLVQILLRVRNEGLVSSGTKYRMHTPWMQCCRPQPLGLDISNRMRIFKIEATMI